MDEAFSVDEFVNNEAYQEDMINNMKLLRELLDLPHIKGCKFATAELIASYYDVSLNQIKMLRRKHKEAFEITGVRYMSAKKILSFFAKSNDYDQYRDLDLTQYYIRPLLIENTKNGVILDRTALNSTRNTVYSYKSVILMGALIRGSEIAINMKCILPNAKEIYETDKQIKTLSAEIAIYGDDEEKAEKIQELRHGLYEEYGLYIDDFR